MTSAGVLGFAPITSSFHHCNPLLVMSCNSHVTLLTNLSQFRVLSHLSHCIRPISSSISEFIKSRTCLVMYSQHLSIQIPVCPLVLHFCPVLNYCPLLSCYCFLSPIIVLTTSFKNTLMSLVVFNCILVLVVS